MPIVATRDLRNRPFRLGDGFARVRPKVEIERKQRDRLPDGGRVDLIAAHESGPQQVAPLRKVTDNPTHRLNTVAPPEIVGGILLLRFPLPVKSGNQPFYSCTVGGGRVDAPQHLAVVLEDLPSRPQGLEVQALHALISPAVGMDVMAVVEPTLAD